MMIRRSEPLPAHLQDITGSADVDVNELPLFEIGSRDHTGDESGGRSEGREGREAPGDGDGYGKKDDDDDDDDDSYDDDDDEDYDEEHVREAGGTGGGTGGGGPEHSGRRRWGQLLIVVAACTFASSQAVLKKLTT